MQFPDDSLSDSEEIHTWLAESTVLSWGTRMLPDGPRVRVQVRELGDRRCACFLVPYGGLQRMLPFDWPEWLRANGLAECTASSLFSVHRFRDIGTRQDIWEVTIRLREGKVDEATCLLPVIPYHAFMAWRGPERGDIVEFDDAPLPPDPKADDAGNVPVFDNRGHEMFARILHEMRRMTAGLEGTICLDAHAIQGEPFDMGITRGRAEVEVTPEFRRLIAHFYEWTEYCQELAWQSMTIEIYEEDGQDRYYLEIDYGRPPVRDDDGSAPPDDGDEKA
jgi:hypothetical protein